MLHQKKKFAPKGERFVKSTRKREELSYGCIQFGSCLLIITVESDDVSVEYFSESLAKTFANIHSHMLTYCCQITHAGQQSEEIRTGQLKKRKGASKLLNRPYSKMILHENIQYDAS